MRSVSTEQRTVQFFRATGIPAIVALSRCAGTFPGLTVVLEPPFAGGDHLRLDGLELRQIGIAVEFRPDSAGDAGVCLVDQRRKRGHERVVILPVDAHLGAAGDGTTVKGLIAVWKI